MDVDELAEVQKYSKKLKLLFVEDDEQSRDIIGRLFLYFFDNIEVCVNGSEALELFKKSAFDIVVTDVQMPVMNGLDLVRNIREINNETPIVMLSAYSETDYLLESIKLHVDAYLMKPISYENFISILKKIISNLNLREENLSYKRNLEKKVQVQLEELRHKDELLMQHSKLSAMGELLDIIAHQWKEPLNIINMKSDFLQYQTDKNNPLFDNIKGCSDSVRTQVEHLLDTMSKFRMFIRPDLKTTTFCLWDSIEDACNIIEHDLLHNNINIEIKGDKSCTIDGIHGEFKHVILNLVANSKYAFNENSIKNRKINFTIENRENSVSLKVRDNAGGIEDEHIEHIFDANYTTKNVDNGTGIGLYLIKMILSKINAKIDVKNRDGGAEFELIFYSKPVTNTID